jgi:hypothetical protein
MLAPKNAKRRLKLGNNLSRHDATSFFAARERGLKDRAASGENEEETTLHISMAPTAEQAS